MNYLKIYNALMERAKNRSINDYTETHHVVPKCLGGSNDISNLVNLTPEEHYLAHQLLVKIHPKNKKIVYAAHMMTVSNSNHHRMNNKRYGWLRRKMSKSMSGPGNPMFGRIYTEERKQQSARYGRDNAFFGKSHTEETKKKISKSKKGCAGLNGNRNGMYGKTHSDETKNLIRYNNPYYGTSGIHPNNGRIHTNETKKKISESLTGRNHSEATIAKLRKPKGPQQKIICPHCGKKGGISNMTRYHMEKCKERNEGIS